MSSLFLFTAAAKSKKGKVTYIEGSAWVIKKNKEKPLKISSRIKPGQVIKTGASSRVEITFPAGHILRINEHSRVTLGELEGKVKIKLDDGQIWSNIKKLQSNTSYEVNTSLATAAVRGTRFDVSVKDSSAAIALLDGSVEVEKNKKEEASPWGPPEEISGPKEVLESEWIRIDPGQLITLNWDGSHVISAMDSTETDSWNSFNESRDSLSGIVH